MTLQEGTSVRFPKMIVRPQLVLNVAEWSKADTDDFVLQWYRLDDADSTVDHYELEMMLTAPCQHPDMISQQRVVQSGVQDVQGTEWAVGKNGVGGRRLRPGNIYMFEVRAIDRDGMVTARVPRISVKSL